MHTAVSAPQPRAAASLASEAAQETASRVGGTLDGAGHRNVHGPSAGTQWQQVWVDSSGGKR